jgi:LmbE family N-acetylglucosaminyl deacetylase
MAIIRARQLKSAFRLQHTNQHLSVLYDLIRERLSYAFLLFPVRLLGLVDNFLIPGEGIRHRHLWNIPVLGLALCMAYTGIARPQVPDRSSAGAPRILIVAAHPDDESCFSVTAYKITHNLAGVVDQLVITNGEGGYRYSTLAEPYYDAKLTTESVGRSMLPQIRKQELFESGKIIGISNHYFLDQRDLRYTQDMDEVLRQHWNATAVIDEIKQHLQYGHYDFVLTLFPSPDTHGAHKAAAWVSTEAVKQILGSKPVVLACQDSNRSDASPPDWSTQKAADSAFVLGPSEYSVDRAVNFGFNKRLTYQIIANWVITSHKSQGAFQLDVNRYDQEDFRILDSETDDASLKASRLFHALDQSVLPSSETDPALASK